MRESKFIEYLADDDEWTKFLYPFRLTSKHGMKIVVCATQELHIMYRSRLIMKLDAGLYKSKDINNQLEQMTGLKNTKDGLYDLVFVNLKININNN